MSEFKVGDKVRTVRDLGSIKRGSLGTITKDLSTWDWDVDFENEEMPVWEREIELVEEEQPFKVGDRVLVTNHDHQKWNGRRGTVSSIADDDSLIRVQIDGEHSGADEYDYFPFFPSEIELIVEPKFKIGDRIKMITEEGPLSPRKGQYGSIIEEATVWDWKVSFSDGNQACVWEKEIELSDEPPFEVGDHARVTEQGTNHGRLGQVKEIRPHGVVLDFGFDFPITYFSFEDVETTDSAFLNFGYDSAKVTSFADLTITGQVTYNKLNDPITKAYKLSDINQGDTVTVKGVATGGYSKINGESIEVRAINGELFLVDVRDIVDVEKPPIKSELGDVWEYVPSGEKHVYIGQYFHNTSSGATCLLSQSDFRSDQWRKIR